MSRRTMLEVTAAGLGAIALPGLAGCAGGDEAAAQPPVRPLYADWVRALHPAIEDSVEPAFAAGYPLRFVPPPPQGVELADFVADAERHASRWDLYVGLTPFADLERFVAAGVIVPWNDLVDDAAIADLHPRARAECTLNGSLYSWPLLLDIVVQGWNRDLVERAGLDPAKAPQTWDEYLSSARRVVRSGAAPYGCTFDPRPWRSLVPIALSLDTGVFTADGLFDLEHDAAVEALELLRRMQELANPDVLDARTTAGVGWTPDEGAFGSQVAAYYVKYQNAHVRLAGTWPDPARLALADLPGGSGSTLFWTSGAVILRYARSKRMAAEYLTSLAASDALWRESLGGGRAATGHLPVSSSVWKSWRDTPPTWLPAWASEAYGELGRARSIPPVELGSRQFTIAQPILLRYLAGETRHARATLAEAMAKVRSEAVS